MTDTTPRVRAPLLAAAQAQKHVTHNEALLQFDALLCARILDRDLSDPPASPADGDTYLVKATGTGTWAGQDGNIAYAIDSGWRFYAPFEGLSAFIADESVMLVYASGAWVDWASVLDLQNVPLLGVNTAADATNKLAVKSSALLFDNIGGGVQVKVNKHAATDTASFLFQTNYSGRAEIGLTGDDKFHFKVSPDGSAWTEAICINQSNGRVALGRTNPAVQLDVYNPTTHAEMRIGTAMADGSHVPAVSVDNTGEQWSFAIVVTGFSIRENSASYATRLFLAAGGNIGLGTTSPTCKADIADDHLRVRTAKTPSSASATGNAGDICWDANYVYVCVAANTWKRAALASW